MPKIANNRLDFNFFFFWESFSFIPAIFMAKWEFLKLFKISYPYRERRNNMFVY